MIDANSRNSYGGIWSANSNYSFTSASNANTSITRNRKFDTYADTDDGTSIGPRMPYYVNNTSTAFLTTDADNNGNWWGAMIASPSSGTWAPAPWLKARRSSLRACHRRWFRFWPLPPDRFARCRC